MFSFFRNLFRKPVTECLGYYAVTEEERDNAERVFINKQLEGGVFKPQPPKKSKKKAPVKKSASKKSTKKAATKKRAAKR